MTTRTTEVSAPSTDAERADAPSPASSIPAGYRLDIERVRALSRVDARWPVAHIALEWALIFSCAWLSERYFSPLVYIAACVVIGGRLHALGIMAHDGAHYLLARRRWANDLLAELFLAWPVFLSLSAYRRMHRSHHRFLNTDKDPDWARNRPDRLATRRGLFDFVRIMGGLNKEQRQIVRMVGAESSSDASHEAARADKPLVPRLAIYAAVIGVTAATGAWKLVALYWLVPFATWFMASMRLKGTAEHFAVEDSEACNAARTLRPGPLGRWLIAPKNVHFHIEHHLYPSVPFYRLPALHMALMELPDFRARAHLTRGYLSFLVECLRFRGRPDAAPAP